MRTDTARETVLVAAGTFRRGSTSSPDEQPVAKVALSAFAIVKGLARLEVTDRFELGEWERRAPCLHCRVVQTVARAAVGCIRAARAAG